MKYRIVGDTMPAVEIMFDSKGESVFTQSGGMTWMSDGIAMATNTRGGLMKGIGRMFAGESLFMATYTAQRPGALIAFASTVAGQIYPLDVSATGGLICQKGAFLCAQDSVNVSPSRKKSPPASLAGKALSSRISAARVLRSLRWTVIWWKSSWLPARS